MLPFKRILFPVDFSEQCIGAARYVETFVGRFDADLTLLYVSDLPKYNDLTPDSPAEKRHHLDSFLKTDLAYFRVSRVFAIGDPVQQILDLARSGDFDLIMMPTHGYGGFRRFLIGSTTAKVLHDSDRPVWTGVHLEHAPTLEKIEIRKVACAVNLEPHSHEVIKCAAEIAEQYGAALTLIHITPAIEAGAEEYLDQGFAARLSADGTAGLERLRDAAGVKGAVAVEGGEIATAAGQIAKRTHADLLVIGRNPAPGILGRLRTHAYSIIRQSPCPVLSV